MKTSSKVMITIGYLMLMTTAVVMIYFHRTSEYCGVIEHRLEHEYVRKHKAYHEPVFIMKFADIKYAAKVDIITYMDHKEGDQLCFTLSDCAVNKQLFDEKWLIIPTIAGIILVMIGLISNQLIRRRVMLKTISRQKVESELIINRKGLVEIYNNTSNQCRSQEWHLYRYGVKAHTSTKLNKDGFIIDHVLIHEVVEQTIKESGSCEEICLRINKVLTTLFKKHKVKCHKMHIYVAPDKGVASMEYISTTK